MFKRNNQFGKQWKAYNLRSRLYGFGKDESEDGNIETHYLNGLAPEIEANYATREDFLPTLIHIKCSATSAFLSRKSA